MDGILVVFNPSITQIGESLKRVKSANIPLYLDSVLELGFNGSTGGREWDLRPVRPRAASPSRASDQLAEERHSEDGSTDEGAELSRDEEQDPAALQAAASDFSYICRPKVWERTVGGGFLGVFRKTRDQSIR